MKVINNIKSKLYFGALRKLPRSLNLVFIKDIFLKKTLNISKRN